MRRPNRKRSTILAIMLLVLAAAGSHSRTWTVAQDGSGDFVLLEPACEAAASGDSILIQPGLYEPEYIILRSKGLAFLGLGVQPDDTRLKIHLGVWSCNNTSLRNLCFFDANCPTQFVGGSATITHCAFRNCRSASGGAVSAGLGADVLIEDSVFEGNRAFGNAENSHGGAVYASDTWILNCIFVDNRADAWGGAVYLGDDSWIENCVFFRNSARTGAAVALYGGIQMMNCTLLANRVTDAMGGAIRTGESYGYVGNLIVAGTIGGAGADCWGGGTYSCCDFWNNDMGPETGCGAGPSYGDISEDPLLCDLETGDVGLQAGSPCLPGTHGDVECGLMGARDIGCGIVPIRETTWGMLKGLYR